VEVPDSGQSPESGLKPGVELCSTPGPIPVGYIVCDVQGFPGKALKRSSRARPELSKGGGIKFQKFRFNDILLLHESHMCLLYTYQLCRDAYNIAEVTNAKRWYHRVRRFFFHWKDIYGNSTVVRRWLKVISLVMRFAYNAVKQPGRSLRERQNLVLDPKAASAVAPIPLGV
jgi:hypothetical protein